MISGASDPLFLPGGAVLERVPGGRAPEIGNWASCTAAFDARDVVAIACRHCRLAHRVGAGDRAALLPEGLRCPAGHWLLRADGSEPNNPSGSPEQSRLARIAFLRAEAMLRRDIDDGRLVTATLARALPLLRQAAAERVYDGEPQLLLGQLYVRFLAAFDFDLDRPSAGPLGTDLTRDEALACLRDAAEHGVHGALEWLESLDAAGEPVTVPAGIGKDYLARLRNQSTLNPVSPRKRLSTLPRRDQAQVLLGMAEDGIPDAPEALYSLWPLFRDGDGVEKDLDLGMACLRAAAEAGHADACYDLGLCYLKGIGTRQHVHMAIALFEQADNANAHWALARMFESEDLVQPDPARAARHRERAAALGHPKALGAALPTEEDALQEARTKLEIAKAYAELGDIDGARDLVEEVLREGVAAVRADALRLRDSLASRPAEPELRAERVLAAPPERVFAAIVDADAILHWWTAPELPATMVEFDPRPGGAWRMRFEPVGGRPISQHFVFDEVDPPRRLSLRSLSEPQARIVATLEPVEGGTRVEIRTSYASSAMDAKVRASSISPEQSRLDRLAGEIARQG